MVQVYTQVLDNGLVRHWATDKPGSDVATHCIRQRETGVLYDDAIDPLPCGYTYDATDRPVLDAQGGGLDA